MGSKGKRMRKQGEVDMGREGGEEKNGRARGSHREGVREEGVGREGKGRGWGSKSILA